MNTQYTVFSFSKTVLAERLGIAPRTVAAWRKANKPLPSWAISKLSAPTNDGIVRTLAGERIQQSLLTQSRIVTKIRRDGHHFDIPENEDSKRFFGDWSSRISINIDQSTN